MNLKKVKERNIWTNICSSDVPSTYLDFITKSDSIIFDHLKFKWNCLNYTYCFVCLQNESKHVGVSNML